MAYINQNLKLCYMPKESVVPLRNGRVRKQDVYISAKSGNGVTLEET
jgi:hypothetical protein